MLFLRLILIASFCNAIVWLDAQAAPEKIEYAYPDISVWTTQRDADGKLKNPLVRLAQPLFEKAGIPWQAKDYPAKRMFANLREGVSKFSMLVNAPSILRDCCLVSKDPVAVVEIRVFHRKETPAISTLEDLNGKSVITIRGYSYAGTLKYIQEKEIKFRIIPLRIIMQPFPCFQTDVPIMFWTMPFLQQKFLKNPRLRISPLVH